MKAKKILATILAVVLLMTATIAGTVAWLTAESDVVKNTFSTSNIGVELEESKTLDLKMIPGWTITKDPKAWITSGSEDAYLFVKVEESANFDTFMTYTIADGWTALTGVDGVYYREVTDTEMGESSAFAILKDNKVTVLDTVKAGDMSAGDFTSPTLTFTAYAHQLYKTNAANAENGGKFTAAEAWANLNPTNP